MCERKCEDMRRLPVGAGKASIQGFLETGILERRCRRRVKVFPFTNVGCVTNNGSSLNGFRRTQWNLQYRLWVRRPQLHSDLFNQCKERLLWLFLCFRLKPM